MFLCCFEAESHSVAQADLELSLKSRLALNYSNPSVLASQCQDCRSEQSFWYVMLLVDPAMFTETDWVLFAPAASPHLSTERVKQ